MRDQTGLEDYERLQNKLCMARLKVASKVKTPDFSINEVKHAVSELKSGKCSDPTGLFVRFSKMQVMLC